MRERVYKKAQSIVFFMLFAFSLQAEEHSTVKNLYLDHISIKEGLSQGTIHSILTCSSGFVWLATDNGINSSFGIQ